jgi:hypothetical protein
MTPTAVDIAACDSTVGIGGGTRTVVVEGFAGTVIVRGGCSLRAGVGRNCLPLAVVVLASGAEMPASHSTSGTRLRRGSVAPLMARINSRGLRARYVGLELAAVGAVGAKPLFTSHGHPKRVSQVRHRGRIPSRRQPCSGLCVQRRQLCPPRTHRGRWAPTRSPPAMRPALVPGAP